jgi:ribose-phosphate pyrophosphokinase
MITISVGCMKQSVRQFTFPGGEVGVQIMPHAYADEQEVVSITAHLKNSDDILALLQVNDAVGRQYTSAKKILNLAYVPYARQDRVCNEGESLSIKVFASLINSCNFYKVNILDPHSDVAPALINNCVITESYKLLKKNLSDYYIVAPDAGAYKKAHKWAERFQAKGVITANKVRDVRTGNILGIKVEQDVTGLNLLVVDDIADGSRTFIELAKVLNSPAKLELFVSHGIFSKGIKQLTEAYDHIYTTNSFHGDVPEELKDDKITWLEI